jgi:uncharacterized protein (TIGR02996 family)
MITTTKDVTTFVRRGFEPMPGLQSFASAIAERPADPLPWLVMADWLDEHDCGDEAAVVRALWDDTAPPADGAISRGYYQWENGGSHWCGVAVECKDGEWSHCYWSNGNWRSTVSKAQAREIAGAAGKPWRSVRRQQWTGETTVAEGVTPYTGLLIRG